MWLSSAYPSSFSPNTYPTYTLYIRHLPRHTCIVNINYKSSFIAFTSRRPSSVNPLVYLGIGVSCPRVYPRMKSMALNVLHLTGVYCRIALDWPAFVLSC